ncbi:MAG: 16S rRNA (guanine(966)-N(2))-methyltransferase RsmD [Candidatus Kapabacteria bacterium]|nr:16S rRNA (guanine(966)-N(2))-methyltransferase RsmD [Candidatus Kapabacteria bacterium]
MRIVRGTHSGRTIPAPPGSDTRPTTDVLKESLFSVIENHLQFEGSVVLDLFAGSGQMSWEALSRGARSATLVDSSALVCRHLRTVAVDFGFSDSVTIVRADALGFVKNSVRSIYGLVFVDPPYALKLCNHIASAIGVNEFLSHKTLVAYEHGDQEAMLATPGSTSIWHKGRGGSVIDVLRYERPVA